MTNKNTAGQTLSILEIERFAIHDGPGIRTVVFLQGCPLRCPWCSNPESRQRHTRLLHIGKRCVGCGRCQTACPSGNISLAENHPVFNRERCRSCESCAAVCPQNAIRFSSHPLSCPEIMDIILRDQDYYQNSGGGVTFSGGEAFMQFEGLMDMLARCKKEKLHTAIETCGQVATDKIMQAFPLVDLFLYDLKHADKKILRQETGAELDAILANLRYIASKDARKIIIRIPCIPGFNLDETTMTQLFSIAKENKIHQVHLLPFHTLGKDKYEQMGLTYPYAHYPMLSKEDLFPFQEIGKKMGIKTEIGG